MGVVGRAEERGELLFRVAIYIVIFCHCTKLDTLVTCVASSIVTI